MLDKITLARIPLIHPKLRGELSQIYKEISEALTGNLGCRFVQIFRSFDEQNALYAQGRTKPGAVVTEAKGGQSYHQYGLAVDFCLIDDLNNDNIIEANEIIWNRNTDLDKDKIVDWMEVVKIFTKYGWQWGASFKDYPHFDKKFGHTWHDLLDMYSKNQFIPGTNYVNI